MKHLKSIMIFVFCILSCEYTHAKINYTKADSIAFENYITEFNRDKVLPINELLVKTAKHFLGKPYVASTLESDEGETLTINLREFDCTTFVESCLALSKTLKSEDQSFNNFSNILQNIRYRKGVIEDYTSRLHYVSDWIYEHKIDGMLENISKYLNGSLINKEINYMSAHPSAYKQLSKSDFLLLKTKKHENQLNKRGGLYVISKGVLHTVNNSMKNGDIVVFSTSIPGLDFSHIGIITTVNDETTFIHASSLAKQVIIERKSLIKYCDDSKKCNGVVILRLNESDN